MPLQRAAHSVCTARASHGWAAGVCSHAAGGVAPQACPPRSRRWLSSRARRYLVPVLALLLLGVSARAEPGGDGTPGTGDLTDLSLEALMDIEVTSVSKRPQKQSESAAAIFVITADDIRRSGATSIPQVLRMVPGLHVARIDSNKWAITARGFNSRFANKLLVLIDGRSVYTPLFAGVYWEAEDTPLEDIDRIEVIRGPGGTLWGANAVNGVINIITRPAQETQGALVSVGAGNEEPGFTTLRYGGRLGPAAYYRVYGKYAGHDTGYSPAGAHDDWEKGQTGFRIDVDGEPGDAMTLQGDYYRGSAGQQTTIAVGAGAATSTFAENAHLSGGNILFRWTRKLSETSDYTLQAYFDHTGREETSLFEDRNTFDVDFDQHVVWSVRHNLLWGLGFRRTSDHARNNGVFALYPSSRGVSLLSAFIQDEITLVESRLSLTVGSKFEHNDFTGFEYQPSVRLLWTPTPHQTVWGAVSRAVRTPARGEHDVRLRVISNPAVGPGVPWFVVGNPDFSAERLIAYELGYRDQILSSLSLDLATFYNDYRSLRTFDPDRVTATSVELPFDNRMHGSSYGVELAAQWQVRPGWRLRGGYSYLRASLSLDPGSADAYSRALQDSTPLHQASLRSLLDLSSELELELGLRYSGDLTTAGGEVSGYTALDARLGWRPTRTLELSLTGWNLLDPHHPEFTPDFIQTQPTEVERSVYAALTWRF